MTWQSELVEEKVFRVRQELKELYPGWVFKVRVIIHRDNVNIQITCPERYDQEHMTLEMRERLNEIAEKYARCETYCPWDEMQLAKEG
jgi:hypothetical protein